MLRQLIATFVGARCRKRTSLKRFARSVVLMGALAALAIAPTVRGQCDQQAYTDAFYGNYYCCAVYCWSRSAGRWQLIYAEWGIVE